ncbi:MAG: nuclear transport factor 2 family protein [Sphingomonas sp.]
MAPDRLARLEALADRQEIADCIVRFSRGLDRFDRDAFLSAFHPDATIAAGPYVGAPAPLYDWSRALHDAGQIATQHDLLNQTVDIDGDEAHVETCYLFIARNRDETNWIAGGRYLDRFARRDGVWRIALRTTTIEWSGLVPTMAIPFADVPGIHANGAPARDRSDPSYLRPLVNRRPPHDPADAG